MLERTIVEANQTLRSVESLHISPLPNKAEITPGSERLYYIGNVPVATARWGTPISTAQKVEAYKAHGLPDTEIDKVSQLGFSGGNHFPVDTKVFSDRVQDLNADYAATLAETALRARGSKGAARIYIASTSVTNDAADSVRQRLANVGLHVNQVKKVRTACAGAAVSLVDAVNDPDMQGEECVVVGLDTLSGDLTDPRHPVTFATFGNGGGAIAFRPGEEVEILGGQTGVFYNEKGTFTIPFGANQVCDNDKTELPSHYQLLNEGARQGFVHSKDVIMMPITEAPYFTMYGQGMLEDFALPNESFFVPQTAVDVMDKYADQYEVKNGLPRYYSLGVPTGHQPSLPVINSINTKVIETVLSKAGVAKGEIKKAQRAGTIADLLSQHGINQQAIQFEWQMRGTGTNNISAGTWLHALSEQARKGVIALDEPRLMLSLGVGLVFGAHIVNFKSPRVH